MARVLGVLLTILLLASCNSAAPAKGPDGQAGSGGSGGTGGSGGSGGTACPDSDGDGFTAATCGGTDCNDNDAGVNPAAREICKDGIDQNCDGSVDEGCDCSVGEMKACWGGDQGKRNVGACRDGYQRCNANGKWSVCTGEVDPVAEPTACDGIDQDCDGSDVAACAGCLDHEICGNGIDDDCNKTVDDPAICTNSCLPSETPLDPTMACCSDGTRFTYECADAPGLPDCLSNDRACVDLDGDPATRCVRRCTGNTCVCGRAADPQPLEVADCGFETTCDRLGCEDRASQNCYTGPPATIGQGICHAGLSSCVNNTWGLCDGQVTPGAEQCANGLDDDCDGLIDEDDGSGHPCPRTDCLDSESCGNGEDDDCDGFVDEGCAADATEQPCYSGSVKTQNEGTCKPGVQKKQDDGYWGPCTGQVLPAAEKCGDNKDTNCNGSGGPGENEDPGCCKPTGDETCNGKDDDCDGLVDEGLLNSCGSCAMSCPGVLEIADLDNCVRQGRTCTQIKVADTGGLTVNLTGPAANPDHGIYFYTSNSSIRRFDTSKLKTDWDYDLGGDSPSIYAASPDGSLWVVSYSVQGVVHVGADGKLVCTYPLDFGVWGLAVDETGTAWILTGDNQKNYLHKVPGDSRNGTTCLSTKLGDQDFLTIDTTYIGSMVAGPPPNLWLLVASNAYPNGLRFNRETLEFTTIQMSQPSFGANSVVDDAGHLWFPSYNGTEDIAPDDDGTHATNTLTGLKALTFTGTGDGRLWGQLSDQLAYLDLATGMTKTAPQPPDAKWQQADVADDSGRIWVHGYGSGLIAEMSYDPSTQTWTTYKDQVPVINSQDGISQRSSAPLQRFAGRTGTFTQEVDGGSDSVVWNTVSWTADTPADTVLSIKVRIAATEGNLSTAKACGPFKSSPADLSTCAGISPKGRFIEVEADLQATKNGKPTLKGITLSYQHP